MRQLRLTLNGEPASLAVEPQWNLLRALREGAGLTGTKEGCATGACGACTVLVDGQPVYSCLTLAFTAQGSDVLTVEGLAGPNGQLHPLQRAFVEHGAVQCGFCFPGIIMSALACLKRNPDADEHAIREALSGNICRCTGYAKIVEAVLASASQLREAQPAKA